MTVETAHIHVEVYWSEVHGSWNVWIPVRRDGVPMDFCPHGTGRSYREALAKANRKLVRQLRDVPVEQWLTRAEGFARDEALRKKMVDTCWQHYRALQGQAEERAARMHAEEQAKRKRRLGGQMDLL